MLFLFVKNLNKNKKNIIGGLVPNICKKIEIAKNEEKEGYKIRYFYIHFTN